MRVAVVGATGYMGCEVVRLLAAHPHVTLSHLTSQRYAGSRFSEIFPAFRGRMDLPLAVAEAEPIARAADVVVSALPHGVAHTLVPDLLARGRRVVDLSADFRLKDPATYARWYGEHGAPHLLKDAVYGLPEMHRAALAGAHLVANPGCYPTGALLGLLPLVKERRIDVDGIVIDSKSGVTGAGRGLSLTTHYCEANESVTAYNVGHHRHTPEIEQELSEIVGAPVVVSFTPHLVPMSRGILTTVYARLTVPATTEDLHGLFVDAYRGEPFVRVCGPGRVPATADVRGANLCDVAVVADPRARRAIVVTALDNLVKGGAGQAVQNLNLLLGWPETAGLMQPPLYP